MKTLLKSLVAASLVATTSLLCSSVTAQPVAIKVTYVQAQDSTFAVQSQQITVVESLKAPTTFARLSRASLLEHPMQVEEFIIPASKNRNEFFEMATLFNDHLQMFLLAIDKFFTNFGSNATNDTSLDSSKSPMLKVSKNSCNKTASQST